jgi:hypothetical protein
MLLEGLLYEKLSISCFLHVSRPTVDGLGVAKAEILAK